MSASDYAEVSLENNRDLPPDIQNTLGRLSTAFASTTNSDIFDETRSVNDSVEEHAKKFSPLQNWAATPLVETAKPSQLGESFKKHEATFPMFKVVDEIVGTLKQTDVVLLIAPTGAGKSVLAPYVAERLASAFSPVKAYRKSLLVAPNVEHCGGTARIFDELFGDSVIKVSAFLNPYEEQVCRRNRRGYGDGPSEREFVICTYHSALRVLPHAKLNLLILDEVHEPNDNVQLTIAMALNMMLALPFFVVKRGTSSRALNKLMLMTATLDEREMKRYEKYFTSQGLSFKMLDFSDKLHRNKQLTLSCLDGNRLPAMFEKTPMSAIISREFTDKGHAVHSVSDQLPEYHHLHNRMRDALTCSMEQACENLKKRSEANRENKENGACDMQSIIVILPGLESVDRLYSDTFKLPPFEYMEDAAFHPVRLTSLVKDDELITSECSKRGKWKPEGHLGRIVHTTNLVASGITVPNAAYVIDSGVQKILTEYTRDGLKSLETTWVDKMMIIQRAGRTGRTTDGEYFLPYSVEKVNEMMNTDHGELLLHRNFEERHLLYKKIYKLKLLHEPPERLVKELLISMHNRGLYCESEGFPKDVILMNNLFNFLSPEHARIVIQGTKMGIAAHAILLVADSMSRVKFYRAGTPGRNVFGSAFYHYTTTMDSRHPQGWAHCPGMKLPEKYEGVGDSIALTDLLASFYSVVPRESIRFHIERLGKENKSSGRRSNFWINHPSSDLFELYTALVKDEGRDATTRYVCQIESALRAHGLIPAGSDFLDKRINRYLVSRDNFCLNSDGRALLSALLTMHSSRVGKLCYAETINEPSYKIYRETPSGSAIMQLYPESAYYHPATANIDVIYGRYTEMFEKRGRYTGFIDPINVAQMTYFLNVNADPIFRDDTSERSLRLTLNAASGKSGIKIKMNKSATIRDTRNVRFALEHGLKMLTHTNNEGLIKDLEEFIIKVWKECEHQSRREEHGWDALWTAPSGWQENLAKEGATIRLG